MEKSRKYIWPSCIALIVANIVDAIATYVGVSSGYAVELNPVMDWVLTNCVHCFFFLKLLVIAPMVYLAVKAVDYLSCRIALFACTFVYLFIVALHFYTLYLYGTMAS